MLDAPRIGKDRRLRVCAHQPIQTLGLGPCTFLEPRHQITQLVIGGVSHLEQTMRLLLPIGGSGLFFELRSARAQCPQCLCERAVDVVLDPLEFGLRTFAEIAGSFSDSAVEGTSSRRIASSRSMRVLSLSRSWLLRLTFARSSL